MCFKGISSVYTFILFSGFVYAHAPYRHTAFTLKAYRLSDDFRGILLERTGMYACTMRA